MATLQASTATTLSVTSVSSPVTINNGTYAMMEWAGSTFIANGASIYLIGNLSGYIRMVGMVYFMAVRSATAWSFGMFSFTTSKYGTSYSGILESAWGGYTCANYQDPGNTDLNYLQFNNTSGDSGTFYFNVLIENTVTGTSSYLTRIK